MIDMRNKKEIENVQSTNNRLCYYHDSNNFSAVFSSQLLNPSPRETLWKMPRTSWRKILQKKLKPLPLLRVTHLFPKVYSLSSMKKSPLSRTKSLHISLLIARVKTNAHSISLPMETIFSKTSIFSPKCHLSLRHTKFHLMENTAKPSRKRILLLQWKIPTSGSPSLSGRRSRNHTHSVLRSTTPTNSVTFLPWADTSILNATFPLKWIHTFM